MANLSSIARPYALAAFEYARDHKQLPAWKGFLEAAAAYTQQSEISRLLMNPEVQSADIFSLFSDLLAVHLDAERKNFLSLLTENQRFNALPEISQHYNAFYAAYEKICKVRVVTATETDEPFRQKLAQSLTKRIQRDVTLQCEVDASLIGGAVIHIGDRVIDGSIRGKLSRLLESLTG
jgi:F-type H+-transporting ATPase subunit delta